MGQLNYNDAIDGNRTFYAKFWQQNGFYPIEMYLYHPETDEYELFIQKLSGWKSRGISRAGNYSNKEWLRSLFKLNRYLLSYSPMVDDKHFNLD